MVKRLSGAVLFSFLAMAPAMADTPSGEGKPETVMCRPPQLIPGSRLPGPWVCKTNAIWKQYRDDAMEVSADGRSFVRSEKWRTSHPQACKPATMGSGATTNMVYANFSMICE